MSDLAVNVSAVSKGYRLGQTGYRSLREDIASLFTRRTPQSEYLWALRDVSFDVKRGEAVGIIGPNGAGKTTILRLLAGVTRPSSGTVKIEGLVGAMIEVFAGLHPELTGRENIYLYGSIVGMRKRDVERRYAEIVEYSGLGKFIETPVKRYSSGMWARLGFSVAAHLDPDVLLVDEVLAVGDQAFQKKCIERMDEFRKSGKTIVYVSHNLDSVRRLCNRCILLNGGQIRHDGDVEEAIRRYYVYLAQVERRDDGRLEAIELIDARMVDRSGRAAVDLLSTEPVTVELRFKTRRELRDARVSLFIRYSSGLVVFDTTSDLLTGARYHWPASQGLLVTFDLSLNLLRGSYSVGCSVYGEVTDGVHGCLLYENNMFTFSVRESISNQGIANLNAKCSVGRSG